VAVDLNGDVGDSYGVWTIGDDQAMLRIVSSASVACGFHGGDPSTLRATCAAAAAHGVAIGAHVSYPDLVGFGRRFLDMSGSDLRDAVLYQLGALDAFAQVAGSEVDFVKPHGALYDAVLDNADHAAAVVAAAAEYDPSLAVLGHPGSALLAAAERAGLEPVSEAYVDRAYQPDGRLVPLREAGSLIDDPGEAAARAVRLALDGEVVAIDGESITVPARSLCVRGDSPDAVAVAVAVRQALEGEGVGLFSFSG
jgi:5-oxoprolinase (ATP-hydrolysing) subunit A